eukprot:TRINITY_DN35925_c0_g1_i1.p1 TRINITY_DN35925_c0_g1~~TRINITY_DN35925_c0_g1_i1.p1  ORF type:complete len:607 (-),score=61.80 TRINITY_DN35925_c0_g1_i1:197-2017(-)
MLRSGGGSAGLSTQSHHCDSFAAQCLSTADDHQRIGLRGNRSPARSFRFGSQPACHGGFYRPPNTTGSTSAVPRSPRSPSHAHSATVDETLSDSLSAISPLGGTSFDGANCQLLRGQPAGKVVESFRRKQTQLAWPHRSGALDGSRRASPRGGSPAASPRSPLNSSVGAAACTDAFRHSNSESLSSPRQAPMLTCEDAQSLAAAACLEAESLASRQNENYIRACSSRGSPRMSRASKTGPSSPGSGYGSPSDLAVSTAPYSPRDTDGSPSVQDGIPTWRHGISVRTAERGASRLFPCHLMTPHSAVSSPTAGESPASQGSVLRQGSPYRPPRTASSNLSIKFDGDSDKSPAVLQDEAATASVDGASPTATQPGPGGKTLAPVLSSRRAAGISPPRHRLQMQAATLTSGLKAGRGSTAGIKGKDTKPSPAAVPGSVPMDDLEVRKKRNPAPAAPLRKGGLATQVQKENVVQDAADEKAMAMAIMEKASMRARGYENDDGQHSPLAERPTLPQAVPVLTKSVSEEKAETMTEEHSLQHRSSSGALSVSAGSDSTAAIAAARRLSALKGRLERSLRSAEDFVSASFDKLDEKLAAHQNSAESESKQAAV